VWDLEEGGRVASLQPQKGEIVSIAFNSDCSQLITVGLDVLRRFQISVWNLKFLISQSRVINFSDSAGKTALVAKQISEFSIFKIRCNPAFLDGLVSCGRENIRMWRVKSQHLIGRPVLLSQYARDHIYSDIAFEQDSSDADQIAYAASGKGTVLKFHLITGQVICAYRLHESAIRAFGIHHGFAFTGGDDSRLRIWPLNFVDFLLEARHEGGVKSIFPSGNKLAISTTAGTIGILDVTSHRCGIFFISLSFFISF
jgi:WD40 repeat protein